MDEKILDEMKPIAHGEKNITQCKHLTDSSDTHTSLIKEINGPIIKAVEFCSNILSRNGLGTYLHIEKIQSYREIAATEIKFIVNSKKLLMKLLCSFPLLFHIVGNEVTLRNWIIFHLNQQEWLKELLLNSFHLVPIFISTVQFYCNELFKITPMFELPLRQLFSRKSKAPEALQAVTRNIKEFVLFLKLYPEIFHLNGDKVLLSEHVLSYKSLEAWIRRLMDGGFTLEKYIGEQECVDNIELNLYDVLENEVITYELVGFQYKFILYNDSIKGVTLKKLLRKNNNAVPESSVFESVEDLEAFVTSYPEVFVLNNKRVFLTHLYPSITQTEFTSAKEDWSGMKKNEQTVVSYYLSLLNNLSNLPGKITEFPINHLLYYNVIAPPEVKEIAMNQRQLKKFLLQFPEIFKINNTDIIIDLRDVSLATNDKLPISTIDPTINETRLFEEAVSFYADKIYELGGTAEVEQLLDYRWHASDAVQSIASSYEELKSFFCSQQNDFTFLNDKVCLIDKKKEDNFEVNSLLNNVTENAISFYSKVLRKHKNQTVSLIRMTGHRGSAPADVQTVAKNLKELKTFFSQFPDVFTLVDDDKVTLSKPSEQFLDIQEQKHTFPSEFCNASEKDTVEFFLKMLNHYGICGVLSINKLFELKLRSSPTIHKISGSNINMFLDFLLKYPQEFFVTNDNVIARKKIPKWSYSEKYENKKFTDPLLLLIFNFFKKYTFNKSIFHIDYLYNNVGRFFVYSDETPVFPSRSDLLLFLGLYPHVFFVDYYRIVNVIASGRKAVYVDKRKQRRFKGMNISRSKKSETSKPPPVSNSKSPRNLTATLLDNELKPSIAATSLDNESKPSIATSLDNESKPSAAASLHIKSKPSISNALDSGSKPYFSTLLDNESKLIAASLYIESKPSIANSLDNISEPSSIAASLDNELKPCISGIKGNILSKSETNHKGVVQSITPVKPKRGFAYKARKRNKAKISNLPQVGLSVSKESLVSELSKNCDEERVIDYELSNSSGLADHLWINQYRPCLSNEDEVEFNPPRIEEIENNIFSHFIGNVNKNYHLIKNNEYTSPHNDIIFNYNFPKDFTLLQRENSEELITEALLFLNNMLWEGGNLKIINIEELYSSFSKSGLEISNCCCNNVQELQFFLSKFPDHFIISKKNIMARKNKILKRSYILNNEEQTLPIIVFHFLNFYTKKFNLLLLRLLYNQVGKYFCNVNRSPLFKSQEDLGAFLEMFPDVFRIETNQIRNLTVPIENVFHKVKFNSGVIKIDSFLDKKLYSTITNDKFHSVPESSEGWKDYVLERTQIIEDLSQCRVVTAEIMNSQKVIALDCEGVRLGATGRLTLVQIGLANGQVYIFDIIKEPSVVNDGGLKDILESESIIKVLHDSKNDVANLYTEFGVKITHIFDTRVAHYLIVNQGVSLKKIPRRLPAIGFNELCSKYGANLNIQKDEMKNVYKCTPSYWMNRPLTKDMIAYAALDVASLVPQIFFTMLKQLKGIPEKYLWALSGEHSLSVLNNNDLLFD